jgi:hypothetical protein
MNTLTAEQVKRLPVGTVVRIVQNDTGKYEPGYIVKSGKRKMLKCPLLDPVVIVDRVGFHYERVKE